ncbi:MAG: type II toxin-antitoxin system RelE/ParE family toxin [Pseudomonadales bacterium]
MEDIKDIVVLEDAANDMVGGREFYESQAAGLGEYFWDSILSDIESLILYAGVHQRFFGLLRLLSRRFPYAIYYEVSESVAYVIAILPVRNKPSGIKQKLEGRR